MEFGLINTYVPFANLAIYLPVHALNSYFILFILNDGFIFTNNDYFPT